MVAGNSSCCSGTAGVLQMSMGQSVGYKIGSCFPIEDRYWKVLDGRCHTLPELDIGFPGNYAAQSAFCDVNVSSFEALAPVL